MNSAVYIAEFAGIGKFLENIDKLRYILFALFKSDTCYRDCATEFAFALFNHAQQALCCGNITALSNACDDVIVGKVVIVVMVVAYVEKAVAFQAERLMYLKVKADGFHCVLSVEYVVVWYG